MYIVELLVYNEDKHGSFNNILSKQINFQTNDIYSIHGRKHNFLR